MSQGSAYPYAGEKQFGFHSGCKKLQFKLEKRTCRKSLSDITEGDPTEASRAKFLRGSLPSLETPNRFG